MWVINLGNIDFKNYIKMQPNGQVVLDEYERFSLHIDSIGLKVKILDFNSILVSQKRAKSELPEGARDRT
jgi:hypothetical protein